MGLIDWNGHLPLSGRGNEADVRMAGIRSSLTHIGVYRRCPVVRSGEVLCLLMRGWPKDEVGLAQAVVLPNSIGATVSLSSIRVLIR